MARPLLREQTVQYKTYLKRALVEALRSTFANHPDELIRQTKVSIEFPQERVDYPAVVVRFFERDIKNAGVGHREWIKGVPIEGDGVVVLNAETYTPLPEWGPGAELLDITVTGFESPDYIVDPIQGKIKRSFASSIPSGAEVGVVYTYHQPNSYTLMKHSLYDGTIQLVVYALSSLDRDLVSDTLVEIIRMGDITAWTNDFFRTIYDRTKEEEPYSLYHYVNIDSDNLKAYGETQNVAPWMPEDVMVYQTTYGFEVFGELYSIPPTEGYPLVEDVDVYPYIEDIEPRPDGAEDPAPWLSDQASFDEF